MYEFLKDFGPIAIGAIGLYLASQHIVKQTNLSWKTQWLESVRMGLNRILSTNHVFVRAKEKRTELLTRAHSDLWDAVNHVGLLMNLNNESQLEIFKTARTLADLLMKDSEIDFKLKNEREIDDLVGKLVRDCKVLIDKEPTFKLRNQK